MKSLAAKEKSSGRSPRYHDYITFRIEMFPFVCRLAENSAAPEAREHLEIRWVEPSEIPAYDLAPADWPVLESYSKREAPMG